MFWTDEVTKCKYTHILGSCFTSLSDSTHVAGNTRLSLVNTLNTRLSLVNTYVADFPPRPGSILYTRFYNQSLSWLPEQDKNITLYTKEDLF